METRSLKSFSVWTSQILPDREGNSDLGEQLFETNYGEGLVSHKHCPVFDTCQDRGIANDC